MSTVIPRDRQRGIHTRGRCHLDSDALARYGLATVLAWIGLLKFTSYEAQGIQPLVANSPPFMSWLYQVFSETTFSTILGIIEVTAAVLLAVKPWWPRWSLVGSVMSIGLFVATISFLFTTRGSGGKRPRAGSPPPLDDRPVPDQRRRPTGGDLGLDARRCVTRRADCPPSVRGSGV